MDKPLNNSTDNVLNQGSPHKKRKIDPLSEVDPYDDVYYKSYIPGRHNKLDSLVRLRRASDEKEAQISKLNGIIMTLKTQRSNIECENYNLEDELIEVKQQLKTIQDQIEELAYHEQQSLSEIDTKYDITVKEMKLQNDEEIQKYTDDITLKIESIITEVQKLNMKLRDELVQECDDLRSKIKSQVLELEQGKSGIREDSQKRLITLENNLDEKIQTTNKDIIDVIEKITDQKKTNEILTKKKEAVFLETVVLETSLSKLMDKFKGKEDEITVLKNKITDLETQIKQSEENIVTKSKQTETRKQLIKNQFQILQDLEIERRHLHNKVQTLKGNVRVYCRIRPPPLNITAGQLISLEYPENLEGGQSVKVAKDSSSYEFSFDKVFTPSLKNPEIFEELAQLVQSSLDGYNVCVFAYGQTGSGKTWTMSHPEDGMIPLTIEKIFQDIEELKKSNWEYTVEGQCIEIYNDNIVDLMATSQQKYEIKHDDINGRTRISNLTSAKLESSQDALDMFAKSSIKRSTASTNSNERSSRSHSIFILNISGYNSKSGTKCEGCLNLIDLAGSERLNNSQVKGDRLKETQHINKSLSSLGDVIYSLSQNGAHIPYRNSKLTYLLKHSLGGDSKTLMFVNISPSLQNFGESLNSFRFATKVNNTKQGRR